jgi:hypothetical protein
MNTAERRRPCAPSGSAGEVDDTRLLSLPPFLDSSKLEPGGGKLITDLGSVDLDSCCKVSIWVIG